MQRIGPLKEHVKHLKKVEKDEAGSMSVVQGILLQDRLFLSENV